VKKAIGIGLMGLGVVGSGVVKALKQKREAIATEVGCPVEIKAILVRNLSKQRQLEIESQLLTTNPQDVIANPEIGIVIEVLGGESPAWEYSREAIGNGKHVVTANKEVIAKHGPELLHLAEQRKVNLLYEASVGGGIPLIAPLKKDLLANDISALHAIINGTTNYILTRMAKEGLDFATALKEAQGLGYAEADPANDINGVDAAYKLAILAALAFHTEVHPENVYCEGISRLAPCDFRYAKELGYTVKLLAIAKKEDNSIQVRVHPTFIPDDSLLAKVDGVFNAVQIEGDLVGKVLFLGEGAGAQPTSSAIIADVIYLAQSINLGLPSYTELRLTHDKIIASISELETKYYLRLTVVDRPGVLAQITKILGDHLISIASVIQKESDKQANSAEIVIMSYPAKEKAMQQALMEMAELEVVKEISNFIRIED
jgi:homoserine dehydrogenase